MFFVKFSLKTLPWTQISSEGAYNCSACTQAARLLPNIFFHAQISCTCESSALRTLLHTLSQQV